MRGRPQQRSKSPRSRLLSACVLLLFAFLVLEFSFLPRHGPAHHKSPGTKRDETSTIVPGQVTLEDGGVRYSAAIPGAPSVPDSMTGPGALVPGHDRRTNIDQHGWQHTASGAGKAIDNGGGVVDQLPPRPPLELDGQNEGPGGGDGPAGPPGEDNGYGEMRVAVLVPYSGPGLPIWFDAFTELAAANKDLIDWIIFCAEVRGRLTRCVVFDTKVGLLDPAVPNVFSLRVTQQDQRFAAGSVA